MRPHFFFFFNKSLWRTAFLFLLCTSGFSLQDSHLQLITLMTFPRPRICMCDRKLFKNCCMVLPEDKGQVLLNFNSIVDAIVKRAEKHILFFCNCHSIDSCFKWNLTTIASTNWFPSSNLYYSESKNIQSRVIQEKKITNKKKGKIFVNRIKFTAMST